MPGAVPGGAEVPRLQPGLRLLEALRAVLVLGGEAGGHAGLVAQLLAQGLGLADQSRGLLAQRAAVELAVDVVAEPGQDEEQQEQTPALQGLHRDAVPVLSLSVSLLDGLGRHFKSLSCRKVNITQSWRGRSGAGLSGGRRAARVSGPS